MSLITRLFTGLLNNVNQATVPKFANEYTGYYVDCINDFYKSGYISGKIDDNKFVEFTYGEDKAEAVVAYQKILLNFLENCTYVNIGNLDFSVFFLAIKLEEKDIIKAVHASTNYFGHNAKDNAIKYFAPSVISASIDLDKTTEEFKHFIESYLLGSAFRLKGYISPNTLKDPLYFLNFFQKIHFEESQAKKLIESFIATYMYGIGSMKAAYKNLLFNEFLFSYEVETINTTINFDKLLNEAKWDELTISSYRKNPQFLEYIEEKRNSSKIVLDQFITKEQFFNLFKAYFFLQVLSETLIELGTLEKLYEEYLNNLIENDLVEIIYCFFVILSIPHTKSSILIDRLNSSAQCVYNYKLNYKPIYSVI